MTDLGEDLTVPISRIGLGTWGWGDQVSERSASEQLRLYVQEGGNFLDTAPTYSAGRSERIVGRLIANSAVQGPIHVATKCGVELADGRESAGDARDCVLRSVEGSLRRLRLERLFLVQVHAPPKDPHAWEGIMAAFAELQSAGLVARVGLCNADSNSQAVAMAAAAKRFVSELFSNQVRYSLLDRAAEDTAIPAAKQHGMKVIAWGVLAGGVLTGKYLAQGAPAPGSRLARSRMSEIDLATLETHPARVRALHHLAIRLKQPMHALALAWALREPFIDSAVVGASSRDQLASLLEASALDLGSPVIDLMSTIAR